MLSLRGTVFNPVLTVLTAFKVIPSYLKDALCETFVLK